MNQKNQNHGIDVNLKKTVQNRIPAYCFPLKQEEAELSESPDMIVPSLSIGIDVAQRLLPHILQNLERTSAIKGEHEEEWPSIDK